MLYNNIDMSDYMRIIDVRGRGITEQELTTVRVIGSNEDYVTYRTKPPRFLEIDYEIRAKNKEELRKKIDEVSAIIETTEKVPIIFPDEPDMIYYGEYAGVEEGTEYHHAGIHRGTIYILRDKYKYGSEKVVEPESDTFIVENNGTADAEPIIELTATEKATFAMVSNGEEYMIIGKPAEVDEQIVDEKVRVLYERGDTLSEWTSAGTQVDGDVTGQMTTDGTGIVVQSYGTGERWHGPALLREIDPIQDFEVDMRLRVESTNPNATYRLEFYLFDEYMNMLGKMAIMDASQGRIQYAAEGRVGPFVGLHVNYLISSKNYLRYREHFHGMLRMRRIGQRFEFYVARIGHTSEEGHIHHDTFTQIFHDVNNEYQGRLKYVEIHIGKFGNTPNPTLPRINAIEVFEHKKVLDDETPYIIYPGDIVEFDHVTKDIRLNGESRKDLKAFGGSFFTLKKGINALTVTPENVFNTKVTYREKYK